MQIEDTAGKVKMNYVCQNVGEDGEDVVINSYLKVYNSSNNSCRQEGRLFKKYPDEERAVQSQFWHSCQPQPIKFVILMGLNYQNLI